MKKLPKIIVIVGATSAGKTKLGVELARRYHGEIISADSRQVYTGMDIGTGKDIAEYGEGKEAIQYHLIDVASPHTQFDLKTYQTKAQKAILSLIQRHKLPIIVGGSGLYLQALVDGYNLDSIAPQTDQRQAWGKMSLEELQTFLKTSDTAFFSKLNPSDQKNKRRLARYAEILAANQSAHTYAPKPSQAQYEALVIGIDYSLTTLRQRIKKRLQSRLEEGMIEEVQRLHAQGISWKRLEDFGLEYKFVSQYLQKKVSQKEMEEKLAIAIGQFAKRQLTWLRRWEKQGREILWFKPKDILNRRFGDTIDRFLAKESNVRGKNNVRTLK